MPQIMNHPVTGPADPPEPGRPRPTAWLWAHLRAPSIDLELAHGVDPWESPIHTARALQLTTARHRRALAADLELLAEPLGPPHGHGEAADPCAGQVREALPLLAAIAAYLRSDAPLQPRGVAVLELVLTDPAGPCRAPMNRDALKIALALTFQWLWVDD